MNALAIGIETAQEVPVTMTVPEIRGIAISALEREGPRILATLHETENADSGELDGRPIKGTVLEPVVTALRAHGLDVDYTYGSVRKALDFHPIAMHLAFCDCENGRLIQCGDVADNLVAIEELNTAHLLGRAMDLNHRWSRA